MNEMRHVKGVFPVTTLVALILLLCFVSPSYAYQVTDSTTTSAAAESETSAVPQTSALQPRQTTTTEDLPYAMSEPLTALPRPNSGQKPRTSADRGGWQQFLVLGLMLSGMCGVVFFVWRDSRRSRNRSRAHG